MILDVLYLLKWQLAHFGVNAWHRAVQNVLCSDFKDLKIAGASQASPLDLTRGFAPIR